MMEVALTGHHATGTYSLHRVRIPTPEIRRCFAMKIEEEIMVGSEIIYGAWIGSPTISFLLFALSVVLLMFLKNNGSGMIGKLFM